LLVWRDYDSHIVVMLWRFGTKFFFHMRLSDAMAEWVQGPPETQKELDATGKGITHVGDMSACTALRKLNLSKNELKRVDALVGLKHCNELSWLNVSENELDSLEFVQWLTVLSGEWCRCCFMCIVLNASRNNITAIPESIKKCTGLKAIILNNNQLDSVDRLLPLVQLNSIVLSHNQLQALPDFGVFPQLRKLGLAHNTFKKIPNLKNCQLNELRINDNKLTHVEPNVLPTSITVLDLGSNGLRSLKYP
jgi:Leucine-rich repeat (LRR) protein